MPELPNFGILFLVKKFFFPKNVYFSKKNVFRIFHFFFFFHFFTFFFVKKEGDMKKGKGKGFRNYVIIAQNLEN